MKKFTSFLLFCLIAIASNAQTTLMSEDFTTYAGTVGTVPAGWTFSYNGNYTTTASSGTSGPNSYKFGVNNATITAPTFTNADTVSFWAKGNSTDSLSALILVESADNIVWDTIVKLYDLPTNLTGQTFKYPIQDLSIYVRFLYKKSVGNCAFDDFKLIRKAVGTPIIANYNTTPQVCFGTVSTFTDISVSDSGMVNSWTWNFGDGSPLNNTQNPTHSYSTAGIFNVTLIATDNLSHIDTITGTVSVDSVVSNLSSSLVGSTATFTGFGSFGSSPYSYLLDLGDGGGYSITTPNYVYTYSTPGSYTACLISIDNLGCLDTSCSSFTILSTGLMESNRSENSIFPNPSSNGLFSISMGSILGKTTITVYDIIGNVVFTKETSSNTKQLIDLTNQSNGSYFVTVKNDAETITKKIIINK